MKLMNFRKWFETLIEEKGIDQEDFTVEHEGMMHFIEMDVLKEFICKSPGDIQAKIKENLVYIDFKNGDIMDFLKHLAKGMIESTY